MTPPRGVARAACPAPPSRGLPPTHQGRDAAGAPCGWRRPEPRSPQTSTRCGGAGAPAAAAESAAAGARSRPVTPLYSRTAAGQGLPHPRAEVAELADALASGASGRKAVGVQIPASAPPASLRESARPCVPQALGRGPRSRLAHRPACPSSMPWWLSPPRAGDAAARATTWPARPARPTPRPPQRPITPVRSRTAPRAGSAAGRAPTGAGRRRPTGCCPCRARS